ncbi:MAG: xanthine dehydrogenase family protein subunit M [Bryobacteraceae bacterium]
MKWFDYAAATSVAEAIRLMGAHPGAKLLAGGTDLLVQLRGGRKQTGFVIDVKRIPQLSEISFDKTSGLSIGAAAPCYLIAQSAQVRRHYPALAEVAGLIGGTQIQGRASIGGNLCNAAPSADAIPLLIALGAKCNIAGPKGKRKLAVEDFCTAPGQNALKKGELLVSLQIPAPAKKSGAHYLRFIPRNEMDIAVAGAGVAVELDKGKIKSARIALASVAPTPLFVKEAGDALAGKPATEESINAAAEIAKAAAKPISDMRGTAEYRRHLCAVLTRRALEAALEQAKGGR